TEATAAAALINAVASGAEPTTLASEIVATNLAGGSDPTAQVSTITFTGSPQVDDEITVTVAEAANPVAYTVVEADIGADDATTLANIAAKVAAALNADADAKGIVDATSAAAVVTLTADTAGLAGAFTVTSVVITPAPGSTSVSTVADDVVAAADEVDAVEEVSTITFSGSPQVGDVITVTVAGAANPVTYTVVSEDIDADDATTLANIAAKVAAAINDDAYAGVVVTAAAAASGAVVTLTADVPGLDGAFTLTSSVAGGTLAVADDETVGAADATGTTIGVIHALFKSDNGSYPPVVRFFL
ncbi:unnamed protein product, partial [marine sediment metagenome]